jgi:NAD(P)-dependent dehydrogenase (short-subunit alcohol dehydrogenase family)
MGRVAGKVAFITGAARGQGRAHAVRLAQEGFKLMNALPVSCIPPSSISDAVLFLASDESKYITGLTLTVDAGLTIK